MLSIAIVTGADPLYDDPVNPVPIVNALPRTADTVPDEPSAIAVPLIVIELFTSDPLAIFISVLVEPLIVLFENVAAPDAVVTTSPFDVNVVNAPDEGVVAPMGVSLIDPVVIVTPVREPPVIETELLFSFAIVPNPVMSELGIVADAVMTDAPLPFTYPVSVATPVPPLGTFNIPPRTTFPN